MRLIRIYIIIIIIIIIIIKKIEGKKNNPLIAVDIGNWTMCSQR